MSLPYIITTDTGNKTSSVSITVSGASVIVWSYANDVFSRSERNDSMTTNVATVLDSVRQLQQWVNDLDRQFALLKTAEREFSYSVTKKQTGNATKIENKLKFETATAMVLEYHTSTKELFLSPVDAINLNASEMQMCLDFTANFLGYCQRA